VRFDPLGKTVQSTDSTQPNSGIVGLESGG
jgi:hypothetical protein